MKMSWTEWKEYEGKRRKLFKENGVIDLAHYRAKARWTDIRSMKIGAKQKKLMPPHALLMGNCCF